MNRFHAEIGTLRRSLRRAGRASIPLAAAVVAASCAGTAPPGLSSGGTTTVINSERGRGASIRGDDMTVAPTRLDAPVDRAWTALLEALPATGIPVDVVSPEAWTAGTRVTRATGRFAGRPISTYLACGGTAGVAEVADAHAVTLGVLATLRPAQAGTELQVRVTGSAKDPFTSVPARHCVSTGRLEARVDSAVRVVLGRP